MKNLPLVLGLLVGLSAFSQTKIDTTFNFQTDPTKKLSIYLPSSYSANNNGAIALALHPWNINKWDAQSWRDTLIAFAEMNDLILICPDGGIDGKVDDAIDIAFTNYVMGLVDNWFSFDAKRQYAMGFSWGGKTVYTYGLNNTSRFKGFLPIGSAVTIAEVTPVSEYTKDLPVYIIHGSLDNPSVRFTPIKSELESKGANVNSNLLNGVGHTIDFTNRNSILTVGYNWIDSVNSATTDTTIIKGIDHAVKSEFAVYPNPVKIGNSIVISSDSEISNILLTNQLGQEMDFVLEAINEDKWELSANWSVGYCILNITSTSGSSVKKIKVNE